MRTRAAAQAQSDGGRAVQARRWRRRGCGRRVRPLPAAAPNRLPSAVPTAGELSGDNIEVAVVGEDRQFRVLTPAEVTDYLREVE